MSADRYTMCPKCYARRETKKAELRKLYGKLPAEQYDEEAETVNSWTKAEEASLRETWFIVTNYAGQFSVAYIAECQISGCGFEFEFRHEQNVPLPPNKPNPEDQLCH